MPLLNVDAKRGSGSGHSDQSAVPTANVAVSTAEFLYLEPDGKVCYEHSYKKALAERRVKLAEKSQNLSPIHGRGELRSPAGVQRTPLRINKN